jgi:branched-chain amino acid transport system permease protein
MIASNTSTGNAELAGDDGAAAVTADRRMASISPAAFRLAVLAALALLALAPAVLNPFTVTLLNYIGIYSLVALGLVLLTGVGGMVSFGQAAFVGIAAYATAWLTTRYPVSPWLGLLLALGLTGLVALVLGALTLKLKGHFLSLGTIAWGLAISFLFGNIDGLGNFNGISKIPPVTLGPIGLGGTVPMFYLIWAVVAVSMLLAANLLRSRMGRAMRVLRGGNILAESLGINAFRTRLSLFVIAALLAALSGWLDAHLSRYVSPTPYGAGPGIEYLMMAMIGGAGSLFGAVVGAAVVTLLKNGVQDWFPVIFPGVSGQLQIVAFSALFILFLQRSRDGLVPHLARLFPAVRQRVPQPAQPLTRRRQPQPGEVLLSVQGVERRFGGLIAVNDVSFDVRAGEIVALIGPNGAGKSTMFNLLTGVLKAGRGRVVFAGEEISSRPQRAVARSGIARTFQHVKLRPRMTLLDNVLLGSHPRLGAGLFAGVLTLRRDEERRAQAEAMRLLEQVGLGERPFELAGNLPLGNQRVLEIARALAADPVLLVLDEPAAGLRRQEKLALADLLRSLRAEHLTVLMVEHDMEFVMGLADRVVVMEFGTKIAEGDPAVVRANPRVQEAYLGGVA